MRTRIFFVTGIMFLHVCLSTFAKDQSESLEPFHNYVVIGAFAIKNNAVRFTAAAERNNLKAKFEMNPNRNLYYVYVLLTDDKKQAIREALRLRKETPYFDTWVFNGLLGEQVNATVRGTDINPVTESVMPGVSAEDQVTAANDVSQAEEQIQEQNTTVEEALIESTTTAETELTGKAFFFKLFRADNNQIIEGEVDLIDADKARKIATYEGNREVRITNPETKSGNVLFLCEVFGYRKVQQTVNYETPEGEGIEDGGSNATIIPFSLVRLQKGDIAVMYNVYFFKDAAVMRPESRFEVTSLLEMLKENPNYKIRIHGHTNGNAAGKIISKDNDATDFFSLNETKDGFGSAKKLSEERADVIRRFLVANGIDESRMQVKAWGGKRPVIDKMHSQAQNNVRVEIEILED